MKDKAEGRRSFLKQIMAGSAVIGAVAMTGKKARAGTGAPDNDPVRDTLYRESEEFRKYYESLRS